MLRVSDSFVPTIFYPRVFTKLVSLGRMLHCSQWLRHRVNDRGGTAHNFAFDALTKVYRDAVYGNNLSHSGNSVTPGHSAAAASTASPTSPAEMQHQLPRGPRLSGVQREILQLYRDLLKETRRMRDLRTQANLRRFIRSEFDKGANISRKYITRIEWQMNYGKNKLDELRHMSPDMRFSLVH